MTTDVVLAKGVDRTAETLLGFREAMTIAYETGRSLLVIENPEPDADGVLPVRRLRVRVELVEEDRSLKQNAFYWSIVLASISEHASIDGVRWAPEAWHELAKRLHLGYEISKVVIAGKRRKAVRRTLRSTTKLSVRAMSQYLDKVIAWAITDLGVEFPLEDWRAYQQAIERERKDFMR